MGFAETVQWLDETDQLAQIWAKHESSAFIAVGHNIATSDTKQYQRQFPFVTMNFVLLLGNNNTQMQK